MKAKQIFSAKKEITRSDAKKLRPLKRFWAKKLVEARDSDNWLIFWVALVMGFALGLLV